jgi:hypothetical protein
MTIFNNISVFSNTSDVLPILNGTLLVELIVLFLSLSQKNPGSLVKWYKDYRLSAVIADVLVVVLGILVTRFIYSYIFSTFSIWKFIGLLVVVQIIHDTIFYKIFTSFPRGKNVMLDLFKDYAKTAGINAILGDSLIVIFSGLGASILAGASLNTNLFVLCLTLYLVPYFLYIQ